MQLFPSSQLVIKFRSPDLHMATTFGGGISLTQWRGVAWRLAACVATSSVPDPGISISISIPNQTSSFQLLLLLSFSYNPNPFPLQLSN